MCNPGPGPARAGSRFVTVGSVRHGRITHPSCRCKRRACRSRCAYPDHGDSASLISDSGRGRRH